MSRLININFISCAYGKDVILKNIVFDIFEGEFLGIIGPNGSGKSTLLRALTRILKPFKGSIFYRDRNLYTIPQKEVAKDFAFVSQDTVFNFSFSVQDIVLMGRIPYLKRMRQETKHDFDLATESLKLTDTLSLAHRAINELSAGERQMVIIAKALAQEPAVLFLDEPTSHLDIGHQVQILSLLKELKAKGLTIVIIFHDLNLASEYCDRILMLNKGEVYKIGTPEEILTYQTIEEVYKTLVITYKNPVSGRPHILLTGKTRKEAAT